MEKLKVLASIVSKACGLDIYRNTRKREYVFARMIYYKLANEVILPRMSLEQIGNGVKRDHATVIHALKSFDTDILKSNDRRDTYLKCLEIIGTSLKTFEVDIEDEKLRLELIAEKEKNQRLEIAVRELQKPKVLIPITSEDRLLETFRQLDTNQQEDIIFKAGIILKVGMKLRDRMTA